jgi:hypothetical protein
VTKLPAKNDVNKRRVCLWESRNFKLTKPRAE